MHASQPLPASLSTSIERCAAALGDLARLKHEVGALKGAADARAHFARALFELELARGGDAEARSLMPSLADTLLVFYRDGTGDELARLHPSLQTLWVGAASMLVTFEIKRFERALHECWNVRGDAARLKAAMAGLHPEGNRRVEFALCLYHLELARLGVTESRAEFAQRVSLVTEAYQARPVEQELVGDDPGLRHLWRELRPYLDEFFEAMEEAAAQKQEPTRKVHINAVQPPRPEVKTDPAHAPAPPPPAPVALGDGPDVPSFRTLVRNIPEVSPPPPPPRPAARPPPPPAKSNLTPPGSFVPDADVVIEAEVESVDVDLDSKTPLPGPYPKPPPAPVNLTPPGSWFPPKTPSGEVEIIDIEEAPAGPPPPPPPPMTPAHGMQAILPPEEVDLADEENTDPATLAFWDYTFASLQLAPSDGRKARMLATDTRADRKRLTLWLDALGPHLAVPQARAFACLVRLMLAGETKEKSLFGQSNPRRKEALESAFALLSPTPVAAGHAAVWFELDGPETEQSLHRGLELLQTFLAFCARNSLDPLAPQTAQAFIAAE